MNLSAVFSLVQSETVAEYVSIFRRREKKIEHGEKD